MGPRGFRFAAIAATLLLWGAGCVVVTPNRSQYDLCSPSSDTCRGLTTCQIANTTVTPGVSAAHCTDTCGVSADCPADPGGRAVTCVLTSSGGQCYRTCSGAGDCPSGFTCGGPPGMQQFCVPGTGAPAGPPQYATCTAVSQNCGAGTRCAVANTTATPGASNLFCTSVCQTSSQCPASADGAAVTCVTAGGNSQCYRVCDAGNTCPAGFTCVQPPGMQAFCTPGSGAPPCGGGGQACCGGGSCTGAGLVCGADNICAPPAYSGCTGGSIGAACAAARTNTNAVIMTTCQRPMISNAGPDGFCTARCTAQASECPVSPIAGRTYNCYILQGAAGGQCFLDCVGGMNCPTGTACVRTASMTGAMIELCMPRPAGM